MTDLLKDSENLLRISEYKVEKIDTEEFEFIVFENPILIGFCNVFETPGELIDGWLPRENAIVKHFGVRLQNGSHKVCNAYDILLCEKPIEADVDSKQERDLEKINQDVKRSRKIAACGIDDEIKLESVLLPLLPIQYKPGFSDSVILERLQNRMKSVLPEELQNLLLDQKIPDESINKK